MNTRMYYDKHRLSLLHLAPNAPASVRAVAGTVVACLHGQLWITQSGAHEDFVVVSGYRYCSRTSGLIVVNAINDGSTAMIYWRAPEHTEIVSNHPVDLDADSRAHLVRDADRQRHQATVELLRSLCKNLSHVAQSAATRLRDGWDSRWQKRAPVSIDPTDLKTALTKVRPEHCHVKTHL